MHSPFGQNLKAMKQRGRNLAVSSTSIDLSGLDSRAKVYQAWNNGTGWSPAP